MLVRHRLRRVTGKGAIGLYNEMISHYQKVWKEEVEGIPRFPSRTLVPEKGDYTWYSAVRTRPDGSLLLARGTLDKGTELVLRTPEGKERSVGRIPSGEAMALTDESAYWVEYAPGWGEQEGWSDLWYMNVATGRKKRLTSKGRYYGVGASEHGPLVIGVVVLPSIGTRNS